MHVSYRMETSSRSASFSRAPGSFRWSRMSSDENRQHFGSPFTLLNLEHDPLPCTASSSSIVESPVSASLSFVTARRSPSITLTKFSSSSHPEDFSFPTDSSYPSPTVTTTIEPPPPGVVNIRSSSHAPKVTGTSFAREEPDEETRILPGYTKAFGPAAGRGFLAHFRLDRKEKEQQNTKASTTERGGEGGTNSLPPEPEENLTRKRSRSTTRVLPCSHRKPLPMVNGTSSDPRSNVRRENQVLNSPPVRILPPSTIARRTPPVSGRNDLAQGQRIRSASSGSNGSVSKDSLLKDLGDAIKQERGRTEMFRDETVKAKKELAEIDINLRALKEKFSTLYEQQALTARNLRREIEEIEQELATADILDDSVAQEYLSLLSRRSLSHLVEASSHPVDTFEPSLLRSGSSSHPTHLPRRELSLGILPKLKRALAQKRIATNLLTPELDAMTPTCPPSASHDPTHAPSGITGIVPKQEADKARRNLNLDLGSSAPVDPMTQLESSSSRRSLLPTSSTGDPSGLPPRSLRKLATCPPISGMTQSHHSNTSPKHPTPILDSEDDTEGFKTRLRKRSNSLKTGFVETAKFLFPSNAPARTPNSR